MDGAAPARRAGTPSPMAPRLARPNSFAVYEIGDPAKEKADRNRHGDRVADAERWQFPPSGENIDGQNHAQQAVDLLTTAVATGVDPTEAMRVALLRYYFGRIANESDQHTVARLMDAAGIGLNTWSVGS